MHQLTNKKTTVISKTRQKQLEAKKIDPDTFPIQKLTADLVQQYEAIWDQKEIGREIENGVGHRLRIRSSLIEHHEGGRGVFVSCLKQRVVLPGTLLGLFPGVVFDPAIPEPTTPKFSLRPYFKRHDNYWLDYEKELPYPMPSPGHNFEAVFKDFQS